MFGNAPAPLAYHEAAHAVMALGVQIYPLSAGLWPVTDGWRGEVRWDDETWNSVRSQADAECRALIYLAGPAGERIHLGDPDGWALRMNEFHPGVRNDLSRAIKLLMPHWRRSAYLEDAYRTAFCFLSTPPVWDCVRTLAGELLSRHHIDSDTIRHHCRGLPSFFLPT